MFGIYYLFFITYACEIDFFKVSLQTKNTPIY